MVQDLSTFYQASYVPPFKDYDGKFRAISVKALRAGLNIQTKSGYFALSGGAAAGTQPFEGPLLKSLADATLPTDLRFHATVVRFGELPDGNTSTLGVELPLAELATKLGGDPLARARWRNMANHLCQRIAAEKAAPAGAAETDAPVRDEPRD